MHLQFINISFLPYQVKNISKKLFFPKTDTPLQNSTFLHPPYNYKPHLFHPYSRQNIFGNWNQK